MASLPSRVFMNGNSQAVRIPSRHGAAVAATPRRSGNHTRMIGHLPSHPLLTVKLHYPLPLATKAPWNALARDASAVIALRLWRVSWLWWTDPKAAERETRLMVSEKEEAAGETLQALALTPWRFWMDMAQAQRRLWPGTVSQGDADRAVGRAMNKASKRLAVPSSRRVKANRKRLGG